MTQYTKQFIIKQRFLMIRLFRFVKNMNYPARLSINGSTGICFWVKKAY